MSQNSDPPPNPPSHQKLVTAGIYRGQDLSGLSAFSLSLTHCDFTQSDLSQANFTQTVLTESRFDAARLRGACFQNANLQRISARLADFESTDCTNADFRQSILTSAVFFDAVLTEAQFQNAHLHNADLRESNLRFADFSHAQLDGADLAGADLEGAILIDIKAKGARIHNVKCTPEQRNILLAAGAYEGLPPLLSRIQDQSESLIRRLSHFFDSTTSDPSEAEQPPMSQEEQPTFWEQWYNQYTAWQEKQSNLKKRREEEEISWRAKQEAERLKHLQSRLEKENKRRSQKEEEDRLNRQKKAIRKQLKIRKQQMDRLKRELGRIRTQSRSTQITTPTPSIQFDPATDPEAQALKQASDLAYQQAEEDHRYEIELQKNILASPEKAVQEALESAESKTRQSAQLAINAETAYFEYVEARSAELAEAALEASEREKERQRQAEILAQEAAIAAAVRQEEAEQRARQKIQSYYHQADLIDSAWREVEHIAKRSKEDIRAKQAEERAERLRQEAELKRYEAEQRRREAQTKALPTENPSGIPSTLIKDLEAQLNRQADIDSVPIEPTLPSLPTGIIKDLEAQLNRQADIDSVSIEPTLPPLPAGIDTALSENAEALLKAEQKLKTPDTPSEDPISTEQTIDIPKDILDRSTQAIDQITHKSEPEEVPEPQKIKKQDGNQPSGIPSILIKDLEAQLNKQADIDSVSIEPTLPPLPAGIDTALSENAEALLKAEQKLKTPDAPSEVPISTEQTIDVPKDILDRSTQAIDQITHKSEPEEVPEPQLPVSASAQNRVDHRTERLREYLESSALQAEDVQASQLESAQKERTESTIDVVESEINEADLIKTDIQPHFPNVPNLPTLITSNAPSEPIVAEAVTLPPQIETAIAALNQTPASNQALTLESSPLLSRQEWAILYAAARHLQHLFEDLSRSEHIDDLKEILTEGQQSVPDLDLYRLFDIPNDPPPSPDNQTVEIAEQFEPDNRLQETANTVPEPEPSVSIEDIRTVAPDTPLAIFDKIEKTLATEDLESPDFSNLTAILSASDALHGQLVDDFKQSQERLEQKRIAAEKEEAEEKIARKRADEARVQLDEQRRLLQQEAEIQAHHQAVEKRLREAEAQKKEEAHELAQQRQSALEAATKAAEEAAAAHQAREKLYQEAQQNAYSRLKSLQEAEHNRNRALKEAEAAAQRHRGAQLRIQQEAEELRKKEDKARAEAALRAQKQAREKVSHTLQRLERAQNKRSEAEAVAAQAAEAVRKALEAELAAQKRLEAEQAEFEAEQTRIADLERQEAAAAQERIARQEAEQKAALQRLSETLQAQADVQEDAEAKERARQEAEARTKALEAQQRLELEAARKEAEQEAKRIAQKRAEEQRKLRTRKAKADNFIELRQRRTEQQRLANQAAEDVAERTRRELEAQAAAEKAETERKELEKRLELLTKRLIERQRKRNQRLEERTETYYLEQNEANRSALLQRLESSPIEDTDFQGIATLPSIESPFQKQWYKSTDWIARYSPDLANRLDGLKEDLETRFAQRKSAAYRERERQEYENKLAKAERDRAEHDARIERLRGLRASAEQEAEEAQKEAEQRAQQKAALAQRTALRALSHEARHQVYRNSIRPETVVLLSQVRFIARQEPAFQAPYANGIGIECLDSQLKASNFMSARLRSSTFINSKLTGSNFDRAILEKSRLDGSNLEHCSFISGILRLSRIRDCQLSNSNFSASNLEHTEWLTCQMSSTDFSQSQASGAQFMGCQLRGAQFQYADLRNTHFDQAELTDADFSFANVENADFRGAIGLSTAQSADLKARGALVDISKPLSLDLPQLRAALILFGIAGAAFSFSYFTGQSNQDIELIEAQAQSLVDEDPLAAAEQYEFLADESRRISDKVAYLLEAAALYQQFGGPQKVQALFEKAAITADADQQLQAKIALRHAQFLLDIEDADSALERLRPFYTQSGFGASERAALIILVEEACQKTGVDTNIELQPIFALLSDLPSAQADLYMALADSRMDRGDFETALKDIEAINELEIEPDLQLRVLETKARIEDRSGQLADALSTLNIIVDSSDAESLVWQAAQLAKTDILLRSGDSEAALENLKGLQQIEGDSRILGRSKLIEGRIYESQNRPLEAIEAYKFLTTMDDSEPESQEEARVSLARVIAQSDRLEDSTWSEGLPETVILQARLGQMRLLLDASDFEGALEGYDALLAEADLPNDLVRAAQAGKAEASAGLGDYAEADRIWRQLLSQSPDSNERTYIMLQQAHGMLQSGRVAEAYGAFESLSQAQDPDIKHQGLMGLAETARANGDRERAKDHYAQLITATDNTDYKVDAYLELALIAAEQNDIDASIQAYESVMTLAPDQSTADGVRAELAAYVIDESPEQAEAYCIQTQSPQAILRCAELMASEYPGQSEVLIRSAFDRMPTTDPLYGELCLLAAQILPDQATTWIELGLNAQPTDNIIEMGLLQLGIHDTNTSEEQQSVYADRFKSLSQDNPEHAAQSLLALSVEQRGQGLLEESIESMSTALTLELPKAMEEQIRLELADTALEGSFLIQAAQQYTRLTESETSTLKNAAYLGLAATYHRQGQADDAVDALSQIEEAEDKIIEQRFMLLSELIENNNEMAVNLMANLQVDTADSALQLRIKAQSHRQKEEWSEAKSNFQQAIDQTSDPNDAAWIEFELMEILLELEEYEAIDDGLEKLRAHSNTEIRVQAHIQSAQFLIQKENPMEALTLLEQIEPQALGPGWDTSVADIQALAYRELGEYQNAIDVYQGLASRWPKNEEAEIPAWLGIAEIHQQTGTASEAKIWAQKAAEQAQDPVYQAQAEAILSSL